MGTDAVGALAAGADGAGSLTLNAPTTRGTYYYGACADAVAEETNTANNCSAAIAVTVEARPDLAVAVAVPDGEVAPGGSLNLRATVRNVGDAASSSTTLRYYRSSDAGISTSDAEVGTDAVGALAAGADGAGSLTLNAPTTPGTYYYGACADAVADETNTANNCSAAVALTVREPPPGPDLVVTATLSDAVDPGGRSVWRRPATGAARPRRRRRALLPVVGRGSTSDAEVGTDAVGALAAGGGRRRVADAERADDAGQLLRRGRTRWRTRRTPRNCSAAVALTVREPPPGPDLVVTATLSDAVVDPGRRRRRRRRRCVTTGRRTRASRPRMRKWARMRWARWRRGRTAPGR